MAGSEYAESVVRVIELEGEVEELRTMNGRLARRIGGITTQLNEELGPEILRQKAEAWDEGYEAGYDVALSENRGIGPVEYHANPYRVQDEQ